MRPQDLKAIADSDVNLRRIERRMRRIFAGALGLAVLCLVLLLAVLLGQRGPQQRMCMPIVALLLWCLAVTVYAYNSLQVFTAEIRQQLARNQFLDTLTEVYNVRYMNRRLAQEEARVKRYGGVCAALYIDVDHFKNVNDTHGHHIGNVVLRGIATAMARRLRQCDMLGRIGGDEFLALLPNTTAEQARVVADRLCGIVRDFKLDGMAEVAALRASVGVGAYPTTGDCMNSVVAGADKAVYQVKKRGGDGVELAGPYEPAPASAAGAA